MSISATDPRLLFNSQHNPQHGAVVFRGKWWVVDGAGQPLSWKSTIGSDDYTPQCNSREEITRAIQERLYPWAETKYLDVAYAYLGRNRGA